MNYRHGFHAGNFADVLMHLTLIELLRLLTAKDKKLFVLDTHAGAGGYELAAGLAMRTREAEAGIVRAKAGKIEGAMTVEECEAAAKGDSEQAKAIRKDLEELLK